MSDVRSRVLMPRTVTPSETTHFWTGLDVDTNVRRTYDTIHIHQLLCASVLVRGGWDSTLCISAWWSRPPEKSGHGYYHLAANINNECRSVPLLTPSVLVWFVQQMIAHDLSHRNEALSLQIVECFYSRFSSTAGIGGQHSTVSRTYLLDILWVICPVGVR